MQAIRRAVHDAVLRHKKLGQSIVVWRNGKVVSIPAAKIRVPSLKKSARKRSTTTRKR